MQKPKMTSVKLLTILLTFTISGCKDKLNLDISIFSWKFQKFYQSNEATGEKAEFPPTDQRADKIVGIPYNQYIDFQKNYECRPKGTQLQFEEPTLMSLPDITLPAEIRE